MTEGSPTKRLKMSDGKNNTPEIISLSSWWSEKTASNQDKRLLLDLRPAATIDHNNNKHHRCLKHPSLVVASLPLDEVKARSFELPARHVAFSILVADDDNSSSVRRAKQFLLYPDRVAANKKRTFCPWNVRHILVANEEFWKDAKEMKILCTDTAECGNDNGRGGPAGRLWEADAMVRNVLLPLLQKDQQSLCIWDMASGAGRDAAYLAEELLSSTANSSTGSRNVSPKIRVTAIDHRYNAKQTRIVQDFFQRRGVGDITSVVKADLSKWETMHRILLEDQSHNMTTGSINVLYCVRFLVRSSVQAMAACSTSAIGSGTIFAISHFCIARQGDEWNFDHPSPDTVLERNELSDLFRANDWEVLHDEIARDSDHGRTMIHFVAKKR